MNWFQAILTIMLGNLIVLIPMLLISHAGTKYGIPFPVIARASFGVCGANLPALLRAVVACGWFGIQTWIGGAALFAVIGALLGLLVGRRGTVRASDGPPSRGRCGELRRLLGDQDGDHPAGHGGDQALRELGGAVPHRGRPRPAGLDGRQAGGLGPVVDEPGTLGWGADFWKLFPLSLMGMIAFWSTLSLNMPDFTRFGRSQREQTVRPGPRPADHDDAVRAASAS